LLRHERDHHDLDDGQHDHDWRHDDHRDAGIEHVDVFQHIEALCIEVQCDQRAQLARLLVTAALTIAANGRSYTGFGPCDAVRQDPAATSAALASCVDATNAFNESGDNVTTPFDPAGPADPSLCNKEFVTACTFLNPSACFVP